MATPWQREIDVDGETWAVRLVSVKEMLKITGVDKTADRPAQGVIVYDSKAIFIRRNLSESDRWATLHHELMHLALWKANEGSEYKMKLDEPAEELLLNRLDSRLYRILNRNFGFGA